MAGTKSIMCFGDSLTWGWIPTIDGAPSTRYAPEHRWTGVMARALEPAFNVIDEGLCGRTTSFDDPNDPRLNGSNYLPSALASHMPLDLVVVMLGTNDTKSQFRRTPFEIANGMAKLVGQISVSGGGVGNVYAAPKILVMAPPPLGDIAHPYLRNMYEGGVEKSTQLAKQYGDMANFKKVGFFNAGDVISTDGCDGIHFTQENNQALGKALANKIRDMRL